MIMSARLPTLRVFWRQCLGNPTRSAFQANSKSSWRYFNSSAPHSKAKGVPRTLDSTWQASSPHGNKNPRELAKLRAKVFQTGEVLLFQSPSHRPYVLTAYGLSGFCFAYSLYNSNAIFRDPLFPIPMWQQSLFGGICVVMSIMGTLFITRTANLVRNIKAVNINGNMRVQFSIRSFMPFKKPYQFDVAPGDISFKRRLAVSPEAAKRYELDSRRLGQGKTNDPTFMKSPISALSFQMWRTFQSLRQVFTNEDFIIVQVADRKTQFRLDSNGYVSDHLLHFGRMVEMRTPFAG